MSSRSMEYSLHVAAEQGDLNAVKSHVERGADINMKDDNGMTPLRLAAESDHINILDYLVDVGADINIQDDIGQTPLHVAASKGRDYTVKCFVKKRADTNIKDRNGLTALHLAAESGHIKIVTYLCDNRADSNIQDNDGQTPLHVAASKGHDYTVESLVKKGADMNIKDKKGMTPLHLAAEGGHIKIVTYLCDMGVDINIQDNNGQTPLHLAASKGRDYTVECLVQKKADMNMKDKKGMTPFHLAAESSRIKIVTYLCDKGADIDIQDDDGRTPLHHAASKSHDYTVECLVKEGADINIKDITGMTPLHLAVESNHIKMVKCLLDQEAADLDPQDDNEQTPLHVAASKGHDYTVECLVKKGADLDIKDKEGMTALHLAAESGHIKIVTYLCDNRADLNIQDNDGQTPLHVAASKGHDYTVKCLVEREADMNIKDKTGMTPLHLAVESNHIKMVKCLLDQEAADLDPQDDNEQTPLHVAASKGHDYTVEYLVKKGADKNIKNKTGMTALHLAAEGGHIKIVTHLCDKGADLNIQDNDGQTPLHVAASKARDYTVECLVEKGADMNIKDKTGMTALHLAAKGGHIKIVITLCDEGADLNIQDNDGRTPLHVAASKGRDYTVECLVKKGAGMNIIDKCGMNPLHLAAEWNNIEMVECLLDQGADIDLQDDKEQTPLHVAAKNGHDYTVECLVKKGADINIKDKKGMTALHLAAESGHIKIVITLCNKGADLHIQDNDGRTPLHVAASKGRDYTVECLVKKGADMNIIDKCGMNPLHLAAEWNNIEMVECLLDQGADIDLQDDKEQTPLHVAAKNGHDYTVECLVKKGADINIKDKKGMTALHLAAESGHIKIVITLCNKGADLHIQDNDGRTPLHHAASKGRDYTVGCLVHKGAEMNIKDKNGMTTLHLAAEGGYIKLVTHLCDKGADLSIQDNDGQTPLHVAVSNGRDYTVECLVKKGADINIRDKTGRTPMEVAAERGHMDIVHYLRGDSISDEVYDISDPETGQITVEKAVPAAPTSLAVEATSSTTISVKWAASTNDGGSPIIGYVVEYYGVIDPKPHFETRVFASNVLSATLNHLTPSTVYEVRVRVENAVGRSDPSVTMTAKTKVDVKQTYKREMRYGHIETSIAKILLFGIAGSGKTSATAILMGEDPPAVRMSTPLMARPVQVITILINKLTKWEKKTPEEVRRVIAEIIRSRESSSEIRELQPTDSRPKGVKPKEDQPPLPTQPSQGTYLPKSPQPKQVQLKEGQPHKLKSGFDLALETVMKEDDFLSIVQHCNPASEPILEQKWLYIIDSGGQPEFHDMLSIFMQRTTACIFVCRMHDELDDYPPVDFYKGGSSIGATHKSSLTNRQLFQQFMCTMRSFNFIKNEDHSQIILRSPPSILLLATHRDLVKGGELPTSLVDGLKAIVLPQFRKQLIYCDAQLQKFIFTMNAKKPEDRDRNTANQIRKVITEECPGKKVSIPIRWYNLDHQSRKLSDRLNLKVLSREEYGKIAKELDIDDESCEGALEFFNSLNTIFYFPNVLPDVVFLEPQILLNLLNELVVMKYRADEHARKPKESDYQFHDVAQVTEELLSEFKEHYRPPLFTALKLAKLFEKLLIFGKLGEEKWFVPSILPSLKEEEVEQYRVSKEEALLIHFQDGGPQTGIFCSTVSFLLSTDNTSPCPWKVCKDNFGEPTCLKRNVIAFTVGDFPGKITLIEEWTHFEIHLKTRPAREGDLWKLVYKAVFKGLEKAAETHHYSNSDNVPCPAIRCPEQCCDHPSTPHPATIDYEGNWECTKSTEWFGQVPTKTIPWLNLITEEVSGNQQKRKHSSGETVNPPKITQHPNDQSVATGMSTDFSIKATGDNLLFQWKKNGHDLSDNDNYRGTKTHSLRIVAVEESNKAHYSCFVKNDAGEMLSDPALLKVVQRKLYQMVFEAAFHGYTKALEMMLSQFGVPVNIKNQKNGFTLLMYACKAGKEEMVRMLLTQAKKPNCLTRNKDGQSVVHIAASGGKLGCLKIFAELENALEILTTHDKNGWNVLHHTCASDENSYEILRWLLEEFIHCNLLKTRDFLNQVEQGSEGYSPLLMACKFYKTDLVKYLLGFPEVDPSLKTSDGLTCLHLAAKHDAIDIAQRVMEKGCPIDSQDKFGNSALHIAHKHDSARVEQLLRQKGGDYLSLLKNKEGKTADEMDIEIVIPIEIERRGQEAVKIYRNALQEIPSIEMQVPCCKLLILGDSGTGKTSLLRLLTGESFIPEHISTEGIDTSLVQTRTIGSVDQQTLVTLREDGQFSQFNDLAGAEIYERVKKVNCSSILPNITFQSEEEMISELKGLEPNSSDTDAKSPLQSEERQMETDNPTQHTQKEFSDLRTATKHLPQNLSKNVKHFTENSTQPTQKESSHLSSSKKHLPPSEIFHSRRLSENVVERLNDHNGAEPELRLVTWDFAGQPLYHPMHHCFITYRAMYIVTFKLNEIVESDKKESVYSQIAFWLNTIQARIRHDKASDGSIPPIFLVGTFRDTPSKTGIKIDDQMLKSINHELKSFLDAPVENRWSEHIQFFDSDRIFAAIENCPNNQDVTKGNGAEMLQGKMLGTMKNLRFIKEKRPLKWLKFEEIIFAMRKDGKKPILVERDKLHEEARELKFPGEEFDLLLQFFHDLGTIVNPRELPTLFLNKDEKAILHDVIILDPQWLAKVMTELMNVDYGCKHNPQHIRQLLNHGLAKQSFLKRLWNDYLDRSNQERSFQQLCLFLQAFCLIIPASSINISTNQESLYLIPCKLQGKDEPPHSPEYPEEWIQFYFDFNGYLPAEVFHRLCCLLARDTTDPTHENTFRYNYCSLWDIQQSNLWLEMHTEKNVLKAYMKPYQSTNNKQQVTLVKYVHSKLSALCSESGLEGIRYIGGPFCPYCETPTVLPLVWYQGMLKDCSQKITKVADDSQIPDKHIVRCASVQCCRESNLYELLTSETKHHPEKSLTHYNIDNVLTKVLDWYNLGTKLHLPDYQLGEVWRDCTGTVQQRQEMISKWLAYDTEASWNKLARALEEMGMHVVAKEVLDKYVPHYKTGSGKEKEKQTPRENVETVSDGVAQRQGSSGSDTLPEQMKLKITSLEAENEKLRRQLYQDKSKSSCNSFLGAEVVGEVDLVVTNEAMNFQWKDHGFKLHVPENALPGSISEYSVNIRVSLAGQFELPENYELVSAVYWVKTQGSFTKPVTIEVQHCANFSTANQLCFVCTSCTQKSLPYKFKIINGGSFVFQSRYGALFIKHFSGIGIAKEVEPGEHSCQYCAQVYFTVKNLRNYWYYCHFVVTKDLEMCLAVAKRKYKQEYDIAPAITFDGDRVALDIPDDGTMTDNGWEIVPVQVAHIKKNQVDNFSSESTWVPECVLLLKWLQKDKSPVPLEYKVKLDGTGEERYFFRIVYDPAEEKYVPLSVMHQQQQQQHDEDRPVERPQVTLNEDDLRDVISAVADLAGRWKDLGISLGIRSSKLDTINYADGLREMLAMWLRQNYNVQRFGKPTWKRLAEAVEDDVGGSNVALAQKIAKDHPGSHAVTQPHLTS